MRIKIELSSEKRITLPVGFNSIIQAMIYSFFEKESAKWLHEKGFKYEKRSFKLFTFSPFLENGYYDKIRKTFKFPQNISFLFSSPVDWIIQEFAVNFIKQSYLSFNGQKAFINSINVLKNPDIGKESIVINAVTPIEVHSTFKRNDGKKITHYYSPYETGFNDLINNNLKKKWESFFKNKCPFDINIKPLFSGNKNEKIRYFGTGENNKTLIKGWKGKFILRGDPEILKFGYAAGLGSRNSQGYGMFEVMKRK